MVKRLFLNLVLTIGAAGSVFAASGSDGSWRLHPTFDKFIDRIIATPSKIYVVAYGQEYDSRSWQYNEKLGSLFVYDKESEEFTCYNEANYLSEPTVERTLYNEKGKYLFVLYSNGNIDLLSDDGTVRNIPGLKSMVTTESKGVNDIVFCPEFNEVYVSTDFGFIVVDDKKGEISRSRVYSTPVQSMCRVENGVAAVIGNSLYLAPANKPLLNLEEFTQYSNAGNAQKLLPLNNNKMVMVGLKGNLTVLHRLDIAGDGTLASDYTYAENDYQTEQRTDQGYVINAGWVMRVIDYDGNIRSVEIPEEYRFKNASFWNENEIWYSEPRKGLASVRPSTDGGAWTITRQPFRPNAPAAFLSMFDNVVYSPTYGILATNHGIRKPLDAQWTRTPSLVSGLKDGEWKYMLPPMPTAMPMPTAIYSHRLMVFRLILKSQTMYIPAPCITAFSA